ncbi:MAG: serine/threonine-protein kinase PknD [Chlamydiales bacterium]|nr:serine/threonine-protein kinase PknD [Chlamydiales bacterium]
MNEALPSHIGPFSIVQSIGKGGMGEVFLAYDPMCKRQVALKRIRTDLRDKEIIKNRFLKEATITSALAHPSIVPIYSIHEEKDFLYYIMPYLIGSTLKECIKDAKKETNSQEGSIPSFLRIFMNVCQAIAYSHSKGFLHRDLKPENIIVGKYGQVYILDWGLVKSINDTSHDETIEMDIDTQQTENLTRPGKLLGTLTYMAPERIFGHASSVSSDIYALGVIFYQILTLNLPFRRKTIKEFRENLHLEKLIDPAKMAPYRGVPPELSRIVKICLEPDLKKRYPSVDTLINDLENYLEGHSEWFFMSKLDIHKKNDWEFQEHVLIPEPIVISKSTTRADWVTIMIAKEAFSGNTQIKAKVQISAQSKGIGFLLSVPEASERIHPTDGYCLWLSANKNEPTKLFHSTVEIMQLPDIILPEKELLSLDIRKMDRHILFYLNDTLMFTYISYLPLAGTHVGLSFKDTYFELQELQVYVGSLNVQVSCLAVPDAFLANKDYAKALTEYRRIGISFQGRSEGREGLFRAGVTLLEEALDTKSSSKKNHLFNLSLLEFEKLRNTPSAPLEYLGKALVYETMQEHEEEVKCFELAFRRYPKHPLLPLLEEQILFRLHNRYKQERSLTYNFTLLILKILPSTHRNHETKSLIDHVYHSLEHLLFVEEFPKNNVIDALKYKHFAIQLAFWLAKPGAIAEIFDSLVIENPLHLILMKNALFCLLELGSFEEILERVPEIAPASFTLHRKLSFLSKDTLEKSFQDVLSLVIHPLDLDHIRALIFLFNYALFNEREDLVIHYYKHFAKSQDMCFADAYLIWAYLLQRRWSDAELILQKYPLNILSQENNILHFLYGCWLLATEGGSLAEAHFSGIDDTPFPKTCALATHFLFGRGIDPNAWLAQSFFFEKRELYKQLSLFYHCQEKTQEAKHYHKLAMNYVRLSS